MLSQWSPSRWFFETGFTLYSSLALFTQVFQLSRPKRDVNQKNVEVPSAFDVQQILERVLRLPSVASKRYLTNKVQYNVERIFVHVFLENDNRSEIFCIKSLSM